MKFVNKPAEGKMPVLAIIFSWVALWNIVFQIAEHLWEGIPIISWSFFICLTVFFMQEELKLWERFWATLIGGTVGLLCAWVLVQSKVFLVYSLGFNPVISTCIPLLIILALIIFLAPVIPYIFNNVGFCYFIIALINGSAFVGKSGLVYLGKLELSLILGNILLNIGSILLITAYMKAKKK